MHSTCHASDLIMKKLTCTLVFLSLSSFIEHLHKKYRSIDRKESQGKLIA